MKADTFKLARDIVQGKWLIADPGRLIPIARSFLSKMPVELEVRSAKPSEIYCSDGKRSKASGEGGSKSSRKVAIVPIHGTMTKYDTCESYGTARLARLIKEMSDSADVAGIILDIDSGGGSVSSVPPLIEAINYARTNGKPVYAHADFCGSAAFWAASQCDAIYLDNDMSEIGSVGCLWVMYDTTAPDPQTGVREITVYSRKSADKNNSYRKAIAGDLEPAMDELDEVVVKFQEAVIAGRPNINKDADGVLSGKMFSSGKAIELGMADAVKTLDETIEVVFALTEIN